MQDLEQNGEEVFGDFADEMDDIPRAMADVMTNVTFIANGPNAGDIKVIMDTKAVENVAEELADAIEEFKDIVEDEDN